MDYHSMSLIELKQAAKNHIPKIKQYYVKSRKELIEILTMKVIPEKMVIEKKTITQLREEAKNRNLTNIWKLRRQELVDLLYPSSQEYNQNNNRGDKHDHIQEGKGQDVRIDILKDA
jgi:hypothetical protein